MSIKIEEIPNGSISRFKAGLVARYSQATRFDFNETFSLVVKPASIRVVLMIAIAWGWLIKQLDVNNALLDSVLEEEVYMEQPIGFKKESVRQHLVCKLHKTLYGLKQAPKAWFEKLKDYLQQMGSVIQSRSITFCEIHIYIYNFDLSICR